MTPRVCKFDVMKETIKMSIISSSSTEFPSDSF